MMHPLQALRHHVTGSIERGESAPIVELPAPTPEALDWARRQRFGVFTSAATIADAYASHCRIVSKRAARGLV